MICHAIRFAVWKCYLIFIRKLLFEEKRLLGPTDGMDARQNNYRGLHRFGYYSYFLCVDLL
jgi:hypothetical protein